MNAAEEPIKQVLALPEYDLENVPEQVQRAAFIHAEMIVALQNFYSIYSGIPEDADGTNPHAAEDLLRAMLVFAGAGLDAVFKQLIRDALPDVLEADEGAQKEFQKFAERRLQKGAADEVVGRYTSQGATDYSLLAEMLVSLKPREILLRHLVRALTNDSLQSVDQLSRAASFFALGIDEFMRDRATTKSAFQARNQITHEMDADFQARAGRRQRDHAQMTAWCINLVQISHDAIARIAAKIAVNIKADDEPGFAMEPEEEWGFTSPDGL